MRPTLTLAADPTFDVVVFECDHGRTEASGASTTFGESTAIIDVALRRHECDCRPEVVRNYHPSLREWRAVMEADTAGATESSAPVGVIHAAVLDVLHRRECAACDPEVFIETADGRVSVRVEHQGGCTERDHAAPTTRLLELEPRSV